MNTSITKTTDLNQIIPEQPGERKIWGELYGSSLGLIINQLAATLPYPLLVITPDMTIATKTAEAIRFFHSAYPKFPTLIFSDWETLPYDHFSPHQDIISRRLKVLDQLQRFKQGVLITPCQTLMQRLPPPDYLTHHTLILNVGGIINTESFRTKLIEAGYLQVSQVITHGEFAMRGNILDIFLMGSHLPYRLELFDEEIESIRSFDPDTQLTLKQHEQVELLPAHEFPLTPEAISHFRQAWRTQFAGNPAECPIYQSVSRGESPAGIEYYFPLFFEKTTTLFDYLPPKVLILHFPHLKTHCDNSWEEIKERYEQLRYDISRPIMTPADLFLPTNELFHLANRYPLIEIHADKLDITPKSKNLAFAPSPEFKSEKTTKPSLAQLKSYLESTTSRVLLCAESAGRQEILLERLQNYAIKPTIYKDWQAFAQDDRPLGLTIAYLESGVTMLDTNITMITEAQIYGFKVMQRRLRKTGREAASIIRDLAELSPNDLVVHSQYGIGRYKGLHVLDIDNVQAEFLQLEYAGGDKIYVPVNALDLISRYTGTHPELVALTKLGTKQWEKAKQKAIQKIRDVAAELLDIYARRVAKKGFDFPYAKQEADLFFSEFPFETTEDQQKAIQAVIDDMTSARCMDRVICGDVGFGKTEVAMRAAFIATHACKQVAVLAPTTLLAEQHAQTFQDRFAKWPVKIAALSRMRTKAEQETILEGAAKGNIDILIGTHKLLQPDMKFNDLGLLIIDEEHRFGVRQKERIKKRRTTVDILTLTATPIPRTLNMAFANIRDLSLIMTAPAKRLSIKTFVYEYNTHTIREAIRREIMRGGQVYYLHNSVQQINATAHELTKLVPEATVSVAHGQMRERELERVMADFYHQRFNVLVCTTIIESGIDIPSANTILIQRADKLGLAQLHQIRGRVGRSHHQAYAYLLTPPPKVMTSDAKKRLEAIKELEELGAGFKLATHDLEIRGAGELLGEEQSGQIDTIGFNLYIELLERTVKALQAGKEPELEKPLEEDVEIKLPYSTLIPESYLQDVKLRLSFYKRIASSQDDQALDELQSEMIDRFGTMPVPLKYLFAIHHLKHKVGPIGVIKIEATHQFVYIDFNEKPTINVEKLIKLIQQQPKHYKLVNNQRLRFNKEENASLYDIIGQIESVLAKIYP